MNNLLGGSSRPEFQMVAAFLLSAGCGGGLGPAPLGSGRLAVSLNLPSGASGSIVLTGVDGKHTVSDSGTVTLACGSYAVSAPVATAPDLRIRKAYAPTLSSIDVQICGGDSSLSASWSLIPTSNKIFFAEGNGNIDVVGFAADQLAASGDVLVAISGSTRGRATGDAFDKQGNLWRADSAAGSEAIERYPAAGFSAFGTKAPDIVLESTVFSDAGLADIAFDPAGNLWVSVPGADEVVRLDAAALVSSGTVMPSATVSGFFGPLAFNSAGTLWIGARDLVSFTAAHLTGTASTPDVDIQAQSPTPNPLTGLPEGLGGILGLAFDGHGNLWVNYASDISRLMPGDLAASGTVTPAVILQEVFTDAPVGLAFDESGDLCMSLSDQEVDCFAASQLLASGTNVLPAVVLSSAISLAICPAVFPAPASMPLFAAVP